MVTLTELIHNYVNPPKVEELFREYAEFEMLVPANTTALPKYMQRMVERMYELSESPPPSTAKMIEELPSLEQKINQLKKKYSRHTAAGFGVAIASLTYLFVDVTLRGIEPNLATSTAREIGLYASLVVGAFSMIHGIHASSILLKIKDVKYRVDAVFKQALSTSKNSSGEPS